MKNQLSFRDGNRSQNELAGSSSTQLNNPQQNTSYELIENEIPRDLVSPMIWIPSAIIGAFLNAFTKEVKSKISAYHMAALFLISPSMLATFLFLSLWFWFHSKYYSQQRLLDGDRNSSFFDWIYDIYYVKVQSEDNENTKINIKYKFVNYRLWATFLIGFIETIHLILLFESYYLYLLWYIE